MSSAEATTDESRARASERPLVLGGVVRVFTRGEAVCEARPVIGGLVVGRATGGGFDVEDARLSRRHFRVDDGSGAFVVSDEGSRRRAPSAEASRRPARASAGPRSRSRSGGSSASRRRAGRSSSTERSSYASSSSES